MKRKIFIGGLVGVVAVCGAIMITACGHTHDYGDTWLKSATEHWHECKNDGCDEKQKDKASHTDSDNDGICDTCEYMIKYIHKHDYSTTWSAGSYSHWYECQKDRCDNKYKDKAYHTDNNDDNKCDVCSTTLSYTKGLSYMSLGESYAFVGKGEAEERDIVVPPTYNGKPVTHISPMLGDSYVMDLKYIDSITLPDSIVFVSKGMFSENNHLQFNEFGGGLYLGNDENPYLVFFQPKDNNVTAISICEDTKVVANYAFVDCQELVDLTLPESIEHVGILGYPHNLEKLNYNEYDNALYLGNDINPYKVLVKPKNGKITSCVVNDKTEIIASYAFAVNSITGSWCDSLKSITLGSGVKHIEMYAFIACSALTEINIPENVDYIGIGAFNDCRKLNTFSVSPQNKNFTSENGLLFNKTKTKLIFVPKLLTGSFSIPEGVLQIGETAFYGCTELKEIIIPNSVVSIGFFAFTYTFKVENIVIPDSVTHIAGAAFLSCNMITIKLSENLEYIEQSTFKFCERLKSITIPDKVKDFGYGVFSGCSNLKNVTLNDIITSIDGAFVSCYALREITLPASITRLFGTFMSDEGLNSIIYKGTKEQWEAIQKNSIWDFYLGRNYDFTYTVHCSDGDIVVHKPRDTSYN